MGSYWYWGDERDFIRVSLKGVMRRDEDAIVKAVMALGYHAAPAKLTGVIYVYAPKDDMDVMRKINKHLRGMDAVAKD
jgi:hypothetical protein